MNKVNKVAICALLVSSAFAVASNAYAEDGIVKFEGSIIDAACTVDIGANNTMTVQLGNVAKSSLATAGSTSSLTGFKLNLKDCPDTVSSAVVKFAGNAYNGDPSVLALTDETGVAKDVGIQLYDVSQNKLPLATASASYPLVEGDNSLQMYASYIAMGTNVEAGVANGVSTFTLNYN